MNEIKDGSLVKLNSGSPTMIVTETYDAGSELGKYVRTYFWNEAKAEFQTEMIQISCLTLVGFR